MKSFHISPLKTNQGNKLMKVALENIFLANFCQHCYKFSYYDCIYKYICKTQELSDHFMQRCGTTVFLLLGTPGASFTISADDSNALNSSALQPVKHTCTLCQSVLGYLKGLPSIGIPVYYNWGGGGCSFKFSVSYFVERQFNKHMDFSILL